MFDFKSITKEVVLLLWGQPNPKLSTPNLLKWGNKGSRTLQLPEAVWFDHEAGQGGGTIQLIERDVGLKGQQAIGWLREQGFNIPDDPVTNGHAGGEYNKPNKRTGGHIVATYSYVDQFGDELFQVIRKEFDLQPGQKKPDKIFQQRRRAKANEPPGTVVGKRGKVVGDDGWVFDIEGVERVPYRLPELLDCIAAGLTIFIPEGEKKVDLLQTMNLPATCNMGGAAKWSPEWNKYFKGATVCLLPDNDPAGSKHVATVGAILSEVCSEVKVLELPGVPPKGDICDWVDAGGTLDNFLELYQARARNWYAGQGFQSAFKATWFHEISNQKPKRDWLVKNLLLAKSFGIIYGPPGCGKSFLTTDLCLNAALNATTAHKHGVTGMTWLGYRLRPFGVVYVVAEGGDDFEVRLHAWRQARNVQKDEVLPFVFMPTSVDLQSDQANTVQLADEISQLSAEMKQRCGVNVELVIIDTVARALAGGNENASDVMGHFVINCALIQSKTNTSVIGVHHGGKEGGRGPRGHEALHGAADLEIEVIKPETNEPNTMTIKKLKSGPAGDSHRFMLKQVTVGQDDDGDDITSCVVTTDHDSAATRPKKKDGAKLNSGEMELARCLAEMIDAEGHMPEAGTVAKRVALVVTAKAVRRHFDQKFKATESGSDTEVIERLRKRWNRGTKGLLKLGVVDMKDPFMWFTGRPIQGMRPHGIHQMWDTNDDQPDIPMQELVTDSAKPGTVSDAGGTFPPDDEDLIM